MLITSLLHVEDVDFLCREDYDDIPEHVELKERLRKTFYYGRNPTIDRPSLPMTELAVEFLHDAAPRQLGKVDMYWASSVTRRAAVSPCSLILGMMYIERLKHKNPEYLQQISSSELFLISMMLASKYLYDEGVTEEVFNDEWAESAKMDSEDINEMEREFLAAIDWSLYTKAEDFWRTLESMEQNIAARMGRKLKYFSYTDLHTLTGAESLRQALLMVLQDILKVMFACSLAYVAGTLTMAASPVALTTVQSRLPALSPLPVAVPWQRSEVRPGSEFTLEPEEVETENAFVSTPSLDLEGMIAHSQENDTALPPGGQTRPHRDPLRATHPGAYMGLPGLLTLALLKDTVIGFTTSLLDSGSRGGEGRQTMCPACRSNHGDDPCPTLRCYHCDQSQDDHDHFEKTLGNSGAQSHSLRSHDRRPRDLGPHDPRLTLGHRKAHDPHHRGRQAVESCDADSRLFSLGTEGEPVRGMFSDISLGFQTASQIPLAA